jgi:Xaa-Pro dipeptidase
LGAYVAEPGVNQRYLAGVRWWASERPFLLVLAANGGVGWICPAFEEYRAREQLGDARIFSWHEHEDPFAVATNAVHHLGGSGVIGIDAEARSWIGRGLARDGSREVVTSDHVAHVRMSKSPQEIALLRRANEATKAALRAVAGQFRTGMRQSEARALVEQAQRDAGLVEIWALVLFGAAAALPHGTAEDRRLAADDVVLVDTGGSLHGYQSDVTRSWTVGRGIEGWSRAYGVTSAAQQAAVAMIRTGVTCGSVDDAARAVIGESGYGRAYEHFTHRLGHGIGLEVHEPPYLVPGNAQVLGSGMVTSVEPGIYVAGRFGVRLEDIVVVRGEGAEILGAPAGTRSVE